MPGREMVWSREFWKQSKSVDSPPFRFAKRMGTRSVTKNGFVVFTRRRCYALCVAGHGEVYDFADHLGVGEAGFFGGHGEFLSAGEPWVWVGFDDVDLTLGGDAHVDAAVVAELDGAVGFERGLDEL